LLSLRGTLSAGRYSLFAAGRRVPPREMPTAPGRPFRLKSNRELNPFVMKSLIEEI
jgi:hypothetical protein